MTLVDETLTSSISQVDETQLSSCSKRSLPLTTKNSFNKYAYGKNYQREKREAAYTQLDKINSELARQRSSIDKRLDTLESLLSDINSMEIEMNGDTFDWTFTEIKRFLKQVGNISEEKFNKKINLLSAKDKQKYFQLDKSSQILQSLKW
jgi:septal ring factor EnvC (AmiA/AmiB activator)